MDREFDSDGYSISASDEELDELLEAELQWCLAEISMANMQVPVNVGGSKRALMDDSESKENSSTKNLARRNARETSSVPETQIHEEYNSDHEDLQEGHKQYDEHVFEYVPPTWNSELVDLGYSISSIEIPSPAVQTLLCCIKNHKVHEYLMIKEALRKDEEYSAIAHLGFSEWLVMVPSINKAADDWNSIITLIDKMYSDLPGKIYDWTVEEDRCKAQYFTGLTALEVANNIKKTGGNEVGNDDWLFPGDEEEEDPFGASLLSDKDKEELNAGCIEPDDGSQERFSFTLNNCLRFPIIPERLVESHCVLYNHAIWRSRNYGALAPISRDAWITLGNITPAQITAAKSATERMEKFVTKERIKLNITTRFIDKVCTKDDFIYISQKAHMAYPTEERGDFYLKKLWRATCPYFKCLCEAPRGGKNKKCKFVAFRNCLKTTLKKSIMAYLSYLVFRETLIGMARDLAIDPWADFKLNRPRCKMVDICEKTIKHNKFIKNADGANSYNSNKKSRQTNSSAASSSQGRIKAPPRITKVPVKAATIESESASVEGLGTPNSNIGHSVTKDSTTKEQRNTSVTGMKLGF